MTNVKYMSCSYSEEEKNIEKVHDSESCVFKSHMNLMLDVIQIL